LPIIIASNKYLAGWRGHLLNEMGRTTLVTSVLASASVYHMSSLLLFKGTVDSLVQKQRKFLYGLGKTSAEETSVKLLGMMFPFPKKNWGLGVPNLAKKNKSLITRSSFTDFVVLHLRPGLTGFGTLMARMSVLISVTASP